ncbi:T9SS type A sorting domain-containing protein [bacterium]|nr:T9SS type A sorting domain-containing protein [bacterium]
MKLKLSTTIFALLLLMAALSPVFAQHYADQWAHNGVAVRQGWHVEWYRGGEGRYEGQNSGEVAFIWSDCRNGDRGVYLQVIDTDQNLKFDGYGLRISDTEHRQEDPAVWPAIDGGWFIGWEDYDVDTLGNIYCTKINADGERLWGENERGVAVCTNGAIQEDIRIVGDGENPEGCIIAWRDLRNGDADIYATHVLWNGELDPDWPDDGKPIVSEAGVQGQHTADSDGDGGMIIGWNDGRDADQTDIWAQRITPNGQLLWGNGNGVKICNNDENQTTPKLCPDGANGAFFTWVDERDYNERHKDIYAQRVGADGRLLWSESGTALCNENREQSANRIVYAGNGTAIVAWEDMRDEAETVDSYSMRISGQDAMIKEWDPATGVPVSREENNQKGLRLFDDGAGGAYYVWEDEREGGSRENDIYAQRININGSPVWEENGIPVCTLPGAQVAPLVRRTSDGGMVTAWGDWRSGSTAIYTQKINRNGQIGWDEQGIAIVDSIDGNALDPILLPRHNDEFAIVWSDGRRGSEVVPYVQFGRNNGNEPVLELVNDGIATIRGTSGGAIFIDACNDENGGTYIVWKDLRANQIFSIYGQYISPEGELMWGEGGIKISEESQYEKTNPHVCYDGEGGIYVAWESDTYEAYTNLYMQRVSRDGELLWTEDESRITYHEMEETIQDIIPGHNNDAVLLWIVSDDDTDDDIWIACIDSDRNLTWGDGEDGLVVCAAQLRQLNAQVHIHQEGFVVVWVDGRDDGDIEPQNDIFGQFINFDGSFRWRENGAAICSFDSHQDSPTVTIDNGGHIWVAWADSRFASGNRRKDIYIQKIRARATNNSHVLTMLNDGAYGGDGYPVCMVDNQQTNPCIAHDGADGIWLVWEDLRSNEWTDIYATHLDGNAAPLADWEDGGNVICDAFFHQETPTIADLFSRAKTGMVVCWVDKKATGKEHLYNIYIQRLDDHTVSVNQPKPKEIPFGYEFESAYPNPFNSTTVLTYVVPDESRISLGLYDLTGRFVKNIAEDWVSEGRHRVVFDAEDVAGGTYFVRFESGDVKLEQKITLVK